MAWEQTKDILKGKLFQKSYISLETEMDNENIIWNIALIKKAKKVMNTFIPERTYKHWKHWYGPLSVWNTEGIQVTKYRVMELYLLWGLVAAKNINK